MGAGAPAERSEAIDFMTSLTSYENTFLITLLKIDFALIGPIVYLMQQELHTLIAKHGVSSVYNSLNNEMYHTYLYLQNIFSTDLSCIYGIFDNMSDKCIYIGCSVDFTNRILWHYQEYHLFPNRKLYKLIKDSGGWHLFSFKVIENISEHRHIYDRERFWIHHYSPIGNSISPPSGRF